MNVGLTVALTLPTIIATVLVVVTPLKSLLEVFVPSDNRAHDALVQLMALVVGVIVSLFIIWAEGPITRSSEIELVIAVILGIGGGSGAVGAYHVANTWTRPAPVPPVPPEPPVAHPRP